MNSSELENLAQADAGDAVSMYCMGSLVANQASEGGHRAFARSIETALSDFLASLSREQQAHALRLSYEMALGGEEPAPPRLRLVYSRD